MIYNIITATFGMLRKVTTIPISYRYDIGQILKIKALTLPESYVVDFCNAGDATTISMVGTADGVRIPDEFLQTGKPVKAYVVLSGADNTQTRYEITIPVNARPQRTDIQPTPEEQSTIDSLIAAMNTAVEESEANADRAEEAVSHYPKIETGNWYVWNPETGAYEDTGIQAEGEDGVGIRSATLNADYTLTLTFTDGTSYTTPSIRGEPGQDGVSPTITVTAIAGGHRVEITDAEGTKTFNVMDGQTGATPDIQIGTVTTLPAGSEATAEITGTPEQPRLNLGIPEGQKGDPGEVTQAQLDTALQNKADIITDTASGAIASFPDGADNLPLKSLVASIEPVQDLHGQDAPYPPGGGKNKAGPLELGSVSESKNAGTSYEDMQISSTNRARVIDMIPINAQFTVSWDTTTYRVAAAYFDENGGYLGRSTGWREWSTVAFTVTPSTEKYIAIIVKRTDEANLTDADLINCKIQLEFNNTATAYATYSNLCPISGWTGAEIQGTGKNLIGVDNFTLVKSSDRTKAIRFPYMPPGHYTFSVNVPSNTSTKIVQLAIRDTIGQPYVTMKTLAIAAGSTGRFSTSFTANVPFSYIYAYMSTSDENDAAITIEDIQLELGSTASDYETYSGSSLSINWQSEAGTVYGGSATYNGDGTWTLVADHAIASAKKSQFNETSAGSVMDYRNAGPFPPTASLTSWGQARQQQISNMARIANANTEGQFGNYVAVVYTLIGGMDRADLRISEYLYQAMTDDDSIEVCYKLLEPQIYTITTGELIETLYGQNNIWVDTGDTTVEYRCSTKLYIQKMIANALNA